MQAHACVVLHCPSLPLPLPLTLPLSSYNLITFSLSHHALSYMHARGCERRETRDGTDAIVLREEREAEKNSAAAAAAAAAAAVLLLL